MKKKYNGLKKPFFNNFDYQLHQSANRSSFFKKKDKNSRFKVIFLSVNQFGKYKN
jgi:hypothetical protein